MKRIAVPQDASNYAVWLEFYDTPGVARDEEAAKVLKSLVDQPLVSVLVPVYNTPERWLRRCIESVRAQIYPAWELCIADDASTQPHVPRILAEYASMDSRIRSVVRDSNGHIAEASNSALAIADRKRTRLKSSNSCASRMPPSALN